MNDPDLDAPVTHRSGLDWVEPPPPQPRRPWTLRELNRAYSLSEPNAGTWCHEPTEWRHPYHYGAILCEAR